MDTPSEAIFWRKKELFSYWLEGLQLSAAFVNRYESIFLWDS